MFAVGRRKITFLGIASLWRGWIRTSVFNFILLGPLKVHLMEIKKRLTYTIFSTSYFEPSSKVPSKIIDLNLKICVIHINYQF